MSKTMLRYTNINLTRSSTKSSAIKEANEGQQNRGCKLSYRAPLPRLKRNNIPTLPNQLIAIHKDQDQLVMVQSLKFQCPLRKITTLNPGKFNCTYKNRSSSNSTLVQLQLISRALIILLLQTSILPSPKAHCQPGPGTESGPGKSPARQYVASLVERLPPAPLDDDFMATAAAATTTTMTPVEQFLKTDSERGGRHEGARFAVGLQSSRSKRVRGRSEPASGSRQNLIEFLESLPILSVGQKHTAQFECDLDDDLMKRNSNFKLVWLKLVRNATQDQHQHRQLAEQQQQQGQFGASSAHSSNAATNSDDITLLSLNKRTITPDKRFKVHHQPPSKWTLTIENVNLNDDKAYYLCQVGGGGGGGQPLKGSQLPSSDAQEPSDLASNSNGLNFVGGARLNVLVPPKIMENETSPNLVQVDEFSQLKLQCKVISEPQSQISWRREDGKSVDGQVEQRFRHHIDRRPHHVVSIDSGELLFNAVRREQAGAYLCIASNGVQPGVSQRISVLVGNCRQSNEPDAKFEPCQPQTGPADEPSNGDEDESVEPAAPTSTTSTTTSTRRPTQHQPPHSSGSIGSGGGWSQPKRTDWTAPGGRKGSSTVPPSGDQQQTRRSQQSSSSHRTVSGSGAAAANNQTDKSKGSRYNQNRRTNQANQQRRLLEKDNGATSGTPASFQYSISATLVIAWATPFLLALIWAPTYTYS